MANEARLNTSLTIRKLDGSTLLMNEREGGSHTDTVSGTKGPSPGALAVPTTGTNVTFGELTTPGYCVLQNQGSYTYEYGIKEPVTGYFYPLGEVDPGQSFVLKLSRNLLEEYTGTGTGTSSAGNYFHLKAIGGSTVAVVKAFER